VLNWRAFLGTAGIAAIEARTAKANAAAIRPEGEAKFWRCGIHPVFYSSTLIGAIKPNRTYLTPFDGLASREKAWAALFGADPEWLKVRADSIAKHGQISSVIQMPQFKAATYSPVR